MSQRFLIGVGVACVLLAVWPEHASAQKTRNALLTTTAQALPAPLIAAPSVLAPAAATLDAFKPQDSRDSEPAFGPESLNRTLVGLRFYEDIVSHGGWQKLNEGARGLKQGTEGTLVRALKTRLAISGDLDNANALSDQFDAATTAALKRFQSRHGLTETGSVGRLTFSALNVPADVRLKQLKASIERLQNNAFKFQSRYVVVNIPGAVVEAISNGKVERRHLAVVGRKERPSPVMSARISSVNLNPYWTVPNSIIKNDVIKAVKKDPWYLNKHNLRTVNWKGEEIDPNTVDWSDKREPNFMLRQDPGAQNSLGQLKIDMPNSDAVYMHDTPKKELFNQDVRFHSSGCVRVSDVRDLAAWLLNEQGVNRAQIDRDIDAGLRTEIKLKKYVPVVWVYLTAYSDGLDRVQFREDVYGLDTPEGIALTTLDGKRKVRPSSPEAIPVAVRKSKAMTAQAAAKRPASIDPVVTGSVTARHPAQVKATASSAAESQPVSQKLPPVAAQVLPKI